MTNTPNGTDGVGADTGAPGGWQPIETAPLDQMILLAGRSGPEREQYVVSGAWCATGNGDGPFWTDYSVKHWSMEWYSELEPTHWMPLPAPPVSA